MLDAFDLYPEYQFCAICDQHISDAAHANRLTWHLKSGREARLSINVCFRPECEDYLRKFFANLPTSGKEPQVTS